jgi:hypothetical protein
VCICIVYVTYFISKDVNQVVEFGKKNGFYFNIQFKKII